MLLCSVQGVAVCKLDFSPRVWVIIHTFFASLFGNHWGCPSPILGLTYSAVTNFVSYVDIKRFVKTKNSKKAFQLRPTFISSDCFLSWQLD